MSSSGRIFVGNGGNATNPMFANISDTHTGIFYPAADNIAITAGGTERLRLTSNGGAVVIKDGSAHTDSGWAGLEVKATSSRYHLVLSSTSTASNSNYSRLGFKLHPSNQNERTKAAIVCQGSGGGYGEVSRMMFCLDSVADNGNADGNGSDEKLRIMADGEVIVKNAANTKGLSIYTGGNRKIAELIDTNADGQLRLYTGESTPVLRTLINSYGSSYINSNGTNRFGIGTASPSATCDIKSNSEHQLVVQSIDGGAGGSMKVYSPTYAYYCSQNTGREWRWGNYGGSAFVMRDNSGTANVFEIDTAGRLKAPASTFYGARASNSITSAQGVASGDIMYIRGSASTSNSAFDMFTIGNLGGNQTLHIEITFHHSGGGTHGSFMRADYGLNSYTDIGTFQNYAHNFGGGGGFSVTRPATGDFKVSYNGSSSFHQNFQLMAMVWCGKNTPRNNMTLTDSAGGQHSFGCTALLNY